MRVCLATLKSTVPYSSSRMVDVDVHPKIDKKETAGDYDKRLWREKGTFNDAGELCIPAMGLKMAVDEAAKRLGIKIPGKRSATYAKYFVAGQICDGDVPIGIKKADLQPITIWANSDGVRGSGKRVKRMFPYVERWTGKAHFILLDESIPENIFVESLVEAGRLIGIGRFRPEKGGLLGRFSVEGTSWSTI